MVPKRLGHGKANSNLVKRSMTILSFFKRITIFPDFERRKYYIFDAAAFSAFNLVDNSRKELYLSYFC